jgi:hypothetical protein
VRRNFVVRAIFVGYRRLSHDSLDNFLTRVVTQNQLAATCMSDSWRAGRNCKEQKKLYPKICKMESCTQKYAKLYYISYKRSVYNMFVSLLEVWIMLRQRGLCTNAFESCVYNLCVDLPCESQEINYNFAFLADVGGLLWTFSAATATDDPPARPAAPPPSGCAEVVSENSRLLLGARTGAADCCCVFIFPPVEGTPAPPAPGRSAVLAGTAARTRPKAGSCCRCRWLG